jgi:hypothetical protein
MLLKKQGSRIPGVKGAREREYHIDKIEIKMNEDYFT